MPPSSDPYSPKSVVLSNRRSTHHTPPVASLRIYDEGAISVPRKSRPTSTAVAQVGSSPSSPSSRCGSVSTITMYNKPYKSYHDLALVKKPNHAYPRETVRLETPRPRSRDSSEGKSHSHSHKHSHRHSHSHSHGGSHNHGSSSHKDDDKGDHDDHHHHRRHRRHSTSNTTASRSSTTELVSYGSGPVPSRSGGKLLSFGPELSPRTGRPKVKTITAGEETITVGRYNLAGRRP